jgi:hypothetical protein
MAEHDEQDDSRDHDSANLDEVHLGAPFLFGHIR